MARTFVSDAMLRSHERSVAEQILQTPACLRWSCSVSPGCSPLRESRLMQPEAGCHTRLAIQPEELSRSVDREQLSPPNLNDEFQRRGRWKVERSEIRSYHLQSSRPTKAHLATMRSRKERSQISIP